MDKLAVANQIELAADFLDKEGWCTGQLFLRPDDPNNKGKKKCCAIGSLLKTVGITSQWDYNDATYDHPGIQDALVAIADDIAALNIDAVEVDTHRDDNDSHIDRVWKFNDRVAKVEDTTINLFLSTAYRLRAEVMGDHSDPA